MGSIAQLAFTYTSLFGVVKEEDYPYTRLEKTCFTNSIWSNQDLQSCAWWHDSEPIEITAGVTYIYISHHSIKDEFLNLYLTVKGNVYFFTETRVKQELLFTVYLRKTREMIQNNLIQGRNLMNYVAKLPIAAPVQILNHRFKGKGSWGIWSVIHDLNQG